MPDNPLAADLDHVAEHIRPLREDLREARIFITGGTGFFGCWLLESLAWANERLGLGAEALVLTRNFEAFARKAPHLSARPDIRFLMGDARDFPFPAGRFSHVLHAATESTGKLGQEQPEAMLDTIVKGTQRALSFALACGAKKFLLTSSGAIYGAQPSALTHLPEDYGGGPDISNPASAYGEGKRMSELLCAICARQHGLEVKVARCFAFAGPGLPLDAHFAIGNFIRDAMAGGPIKVNGDGTPFRSYLYAADLAIWLWTILIKGVSNRPYNVGSRHAFTIAQIAETVSRALPGQVPVEIARKAVPGQPAARYVPDTSRAEQELGLRDWVPLDEAIRRTAMRARRTKDRAQ
jgi:dTDP-glucose 4,6-dehydratase